MTHKNIKKITGSESNLEAKATWISELTCPKCGHKKTETMPTDACQWFYECNQCHALLKPIPGDCCVFCSYGSVKCPPVQTNKTGCCLDEE